MSSRQHLLHWPCQQHVALGQVEYIISPAAWDLLGNQCIASSQRLNKGQDKPCHLMERSHSTVAVLTADGGCFMALQPFSAARMCSPAAQDDTPGVHCQPGNQACWTLLGGMQLALSARGRPHLAGWGPPTALQAPSCHCCGYSCCHAKSLQTGAKPIVCVDGSCQGSQELCSAIRPICSGAPAFRWPLVLVANVSKFLDQCAGAARQTALWRYI